MGDSNTVVGAYTMYRHLQQYCSRPSIGACIRDTDLMNLVSSHELLLNPTFFRLQLFVKNGPA